jgi:hypothetical protein
MQIDATSVCSKAPRLVLGQTLREGATVGLIVKVEITERTETPVRRHWIRNQRRRENASSATAPMTIAPLIRD